MVAGIGASFGASSSTGSVIFAGVTLGLSTIVSWSHTSVQFRAPAGTGANKVRVCLRKQFDACAISLTYVMCDMQLVSLVVGSQNSFNNPSVSYIAPSISGVSPTPGVTVGGTTLNVDGMP